MNRKLGIMISAAPGTAAFDQGAGLAEAALGKGAGVYIYWIDEAVRGLGDPRVQALRASGARLFACAYSLQRRGLREDGGCILAGLTILSDLIASTDRFASFT
jgi:sulfur relay (sulfurtransferase) complex TusBCD TusD component (DsrE family)